MKRRDAWKTASFWRDVLEILLFFLVVALVLWFIIRMAVLTDEFFRNREVKTAQTEVDEEEGAGRATSYLSGVYAEGELSAYAEENPRFEVYVEGGGTAPAWYRPDEEMAVEWQAAEPHPPEGIDPGGIDWNVETAIYGWNGHMMTGVELDLFSRIFYCEFWQPNLTLCEAGCDAMLGLWDLNGGTMYETLSHVNENGSYTFSTYPGVWEEDYDPDGFAWCRAFCEERFYHGPVWPAQYFRKEHYHDWGEWSPIPAYEIDGIYFSIGKEYGE